MTFAMWCTLVCWVGVLVGCCCLRAVIRKARQIIAAATDLDARTADFRTYVTDRQARLDREWRALQIAQGAPRCDGCGAYFAQTGPRDWAHTYCAAQSAKAP